MGLFTPRTKGRGWAARRERPRKFETSDRDAPNDIKPLPSTSSQSENLGELPRTLPLPPSVRKSVPAAPKAESVAAPFHWRPVQVRQHEQRSELSHTVGTYVNTLSMNISQKTFEGATAHLIRVEPGNFIAKDSVFCYLLGGSFVICRGVVVGICPREHDPASGRSMRIGRLPAHMRPQKPLHFAALSREAYALSGHIAYSSHLVNLIVTTDGWISGVSSRESEGAIDLSAVRFCLSGGISLVDGVSLHTCDVAGTRLVTLQGVLTERFFAVHSHKPLALLPDSCRPQTELPFIVAGTSPGGFHLLMARPSYSCGVGGDLLWRDSMWNRDALNLTGMMYEVAPDALTCSTLDSSWTVETLQVFVKDFQNFLVRKFGSIEEAWSVAFDTDGSGFINFTEFGLGCKSSGFVGNATRLWAALDEDRSGEISMEELNIGMAELRSAMSSPKREQKWLLTLDRMNLKDQDPARLPGEVEADDE